MSKSAEWYETFEKGWWLKGDNTGADEAAAIKRLLRLRKGQAVLDAPCGAGRISFHLAKAGCRVVGVDRMPVFIKRARQRFQKEGLEEQFLRGDLRELGFEGEFDAVINFGGSFGYFSDQGNLEVLRRFSLALKSGGQVLIDQPNREFVLRHFHRKMTQGDLSLRSKWNHRTECVETTWTKIVSGTRRSSRSSIRFYTPSQFRKLFARAGLEVEAMYGTLEGGRYARGSHRIYVIGRKT